MKRVWSTIALTGTALALLSCGPNPRMSAIDAAVRIYSIKEAEAFLPHMAREHFEKVVLLGSLPGDFGRISDRAPLVDNTSEILAIAKKYPKQFAAFPALHAGYADLLTYANTLVQEGAKGFVVTAPRGSEPMPVNDAAYGPLYGFLEESGLPVFISVSTPRDLAALESVLAGHAKLKVVCPRFCTAPQNPKRLEALLEKYPGLAIDMGASDVPGLEGHILQVSQNSAAMRALVLAHPNRFLFATHLMIGPSSFADDAEEVHMSYRGYRRLLNDAHFDFPPLAQRWKKRGMRLPVNGSLYGLFLPEEVLQKVYRDNAQKLFDFAP